MGVPYIIDITALRTIYCFRSDPKREFGTPYRDYQYAWLC